MSSRSSEAIAAGMPAREACGARVAVTGATGFIGRRVVERLRAEGFEVKALVRRGAAPVADAEAVQGDLADSDALIRLAEGCDAVVHCAALVAAGSRAAFERTNAAGTRAMAEAAATAGASRLLLVSSLAAREPHLSAYAASKRAGEDACAEVARRGGLAWDALRPPAVYGPGDRQILRLLRLLRGGFAVMPAGADSRLSLLHVDDVAGAVVAWVKSGQARGVAYELPDEAEAGYSWEQVMAVAAEALDVTPRPLRPSRTALRLLGHGLHLTGLVTRRPPLLTADKVAELCHEDWVCRDRRFEADTLWRPCIPLDAGLRETVAWYRARNWL